MNVCDSLYQINNSVTREVQLALYNGNFPCPLWSWIPVKFYYSGDLSVTKFSFDLAQIAFQGQYSEIYEHNSMFCRRNVFKLAKTDIHDYIVINYVFNVKQMTKKEREHYIQRNFLTNETLSKFSSTTFQLEQIESMSKAPDLVQTPKVPEFLANQYNEYICMAISCVIDLKQLEAQNGIHNLLLHVLQSHLNDMALLVQSYITKINVTELRQIVSGKMEQLNKSINQITNQEQHHTSYYANAFCKCHMYNNLTEQIFKKGKIYNLHTQSPRNNSSDETKAQKLQQIKIIQYLQQQMLQQNNEQPDEQNYNRQCHCLSINDEYNDQNTQQEQFNSKQNANKDVQLICIANKATENDDKQQSQAQSEVSQSNATVTIQLEENDSVYHYNIPNTIWDRNLFNEHLNTLKQIAMKQTYLTQKSVHDGEKLDISIDTLQKDMVNTSYIQKTFRESQVDQALKNLTDSKIIQQIQQQLLISGYKMVIIGPPVLADLLAKSLSILVPPDIREKIIYSDRSNENGQGVCNCTVNTEYIIEMLTQAQNKPKSRRMSISIQDAEQQLIYTNASNNPVTYQTDSHISHISGSFETHHSNTVVMSKNISSISGGENSQLAYELSNALMPRFTCQQCGKFYHGIHYISGTTIQTISGTKRSVKLLNLILQTDKSPTFVFLTEKDVIRPSIQANRFGAQYSWKEIKQKLWRAILRKKAADIVFMMERYHMLLQELQNQIQKVQKNIQTQQSMLHTAGQSLQAHTVYLSLAQFIGETFSAFQLQEGLVQQAKAKQDSQTSNPVYDTMLTHIRLNSETINKQIAQYKQNYSTYIKQFTVSPNSSNPTESISIHYGPRLVKLYMNNVYNTNELLEEDLQLCLHSISTGHISLDILPNGALQYVKSQQQFLIQFLTQDNPLQTFKKLPAFVRTYMQDLGYIITSLTQYYLQIQ